MNADYERLTAIVTKFEQKWIDSGPPMPPSAYYAMWDELREEVAKVGGPMAADLIESIDIIRSRRPH